MSILFLDKNNLVRKQRLQSSIVYWIFLAWFSWALGITTMTNTAWMKFLSFPLNRLEAFRFLDSCVDCPTAPCCMEKFKWKNSWIIMYSYPYDTSMTTSRILLCSYFLLRDASIVSKTETIAKATKNMWDLKIKIFSAKFSSVTWLFCNCILWFELYHFII